MRTHPDLLPPAEVTEVDQRQINKLVAALKLANPAVTAEVEVNEEGTPYVHIGTPDDTLSYLIEPYKRGWRGWSSGALTLSTQVAMTAGAVALAAGMTWATEIRQIAMAATTMLTGGG